MLNRPVTTEQLYLNEILGELRAIRKALTPLVSEQAEWLPDERLIRLREKRDRAKEKTFRQGG